MSPQPPRIVWVADDSPLEAEVVSRVLSPHFKVELFSDGPSLIERAQQSPPPLLVLDWQMPGMTGIDVCRFLRAQPARLADVGILIITAVHPRTSDVVYALNAGANDYLVKPFVAVRAFGARGGDVPCARRHAPAPLRASTMARSPPRAASRTPFSPIRRRGAAWPFANTEAERLFGWSGHLPEGELLSELVPGLAATELTQDSGPSTITVPVSDRLFLPAVRPLSLGEGPTLVTISLRDITEHVRREERIRDEREELIVALERSNRDLDQFAYVASHDLKAPLRGIGNLASWIQDDLGPNASEQTREHLNLLHVQVERMNALDQRHRLRTQSRGARTPKKSSRWTWISFARSRRDVEPRADGQIEIAPGMPTALPSPRTAFEQVFLNLIGNAVKHAHRDDVEVRVGVVEGEEFWEFTVADNGPGIPPESHEAIWEFFLNARYASSRKAEGTGLGLSIVKKVA